VTGTVNSNQKVSTSGIAPAFNAAAAQMEVPVSSERVIGPFPRATYNMGNGNIQVLIDVPANCTVTAYEHQ
jgi:hypothetical protein